MIVCPACKSQQINGTLFCSECGSDLQNPSSPTHGLHDDNSQDLVIQTGNRVPTKFNSFQLDSLESYFLSPVSKPTEEPAQIQIREEFKLVVLNSGRKLDCPDKANIIIGRCDAFTGEAPDIDLAPDDALELGVSRRHACITFREGAPFITDLGSTNRTFINRQVMMRGQPYSLKDEDEIRLGNVILKVFFKPSN